MWQNSNFAKANEQVEVKDRKVGELCMHVFSFFLSFFLQANTPLPPHRRHFVLLFYEGDAVCGIPPWECVMQSRGTGMQNRR